MKKLLSIPLLTILLVSGCDRTQNPLLSEPSSTVNSIRLTCPQIENRNFPECRAFVLVTDQADNPITDFTIGNFSVLEDGKPSVVTDVKKVTDPLSIVICLDRSGSMRGSATTNANTAAKRLIDEAETNDYIAIVDFATEVTVTQNFTNDKTLLKDQIDTGVPYGPTALYDAIAKSAQLLESRIGRKFLLVLTDGINNSSIFYTDEEAASDEVNRRGVSAYIIGLGSNVESANLQTISNNTSGRYYEAPTSSQLPTIFSTILNLMQNLVEVEFKSRLKKEFRELDVYINYGSFETSCRRKYGH